MSTTNILDLNNRLDRLEKSGSGGGSAAETTYSNTTSGLTATNVQDAIDEIDGVTDNLAGSITDIEGDIVAIEGDIDDLDTRIDTLEVDTGWVQIGTGNTYYRKVGKIVYVRTIVPKAATSNWITIDTLPEGYRPISAFNFCIYCFGSAQVIAQILTTGALQYASIGVNTDFPLYASFIADN